MHQSKPQVRQAGEQGKERKPMGRRVFGAVTGFVLAATVAWAAWTVLSHNNDPATGGKVKTGSLAAPTWEEAVNGEISSTLTPGETGDLTFRIVNPNEAPLTLTNLDTNGSFSRTSTPNGACGSSIMLTGIPFSGSISVPVGSSVVVVPDVVTLDPDTTSACQGQTISVSGLTATFSS